VPLSFRRSFHKKPSAKIAQNKRRLAPGRQSGGRVRPPDTVRASRYPIGLMVGIGVLLVIAVVVVVNSRLLNLPMAESRAETATPAPATPRYQTAVAARLSTLAAATRTAFPSPSSTPIPPSPILSPTNTVAASATTAASATLPPANPWAAEIPSAACIREDLPQTGLVVGIVDGDTIRVRLDGEQRVYSVRYIGVQAPRAGQYYAALSEAANLDLAYLKQAVLVRDLTDTDPQGTLLRYVMAEGKFVNYELIAGGYAQARASAPDTACLSSFRAAQQKAQSGKLGMWSGPAYLIPILPTP
jgi:endonuclease YncB( thermonuclease family)